MFHLLNIYIRFLFFQLHVQIQVPKPTGACPKRMHIENPRLCISLLFISRRKINFKQFQEALKLLAEKKYPGDAEGYNKLKEVIIQAKGPATTGATVSLNYFSRIALLRIATFLFKFEILLFPTMSLPSL